MTPRNALGSSLVMENTPRQLLDGILIKHYCISEHEYYDYCGGVSPYPILHGNIMPGKDTDEGPELNEKFKKVLPKTMIKNSLKR